MVCLLAAILALPCRSAGAQAAPSVRLTFEFAREDLEIRNQTLPGQRWLSHVRLRGADLEREPGFPELPCVTRAVLLPRGALLKDLVVTEGKEIPFADVGLVSWAQPPQAGRDPVLPREPPGGPLSYPRSMAVDMSPLVSQHPAWPPKLVEVSREEETAGGFRRVSLKVHPVRWYPSQRRLGLQSNLTVEVVHSGGDWKPVREDYPSAMHFEFLRSVVANLQDLPRIDIPLMPEDLDAEYLIISDNFRWSSDHRKGPSVDGDMLAEFRRLARWKTERGVKTEVVTISDIVARRYGDFGTGAADLQETLRNFLKHARESWHTYWVLLGGDVEIIPPRKVVGCVGHGSHYFWRTDVELPSEAERCYWWAEGGRVRICHNGDVEPHEWIVSFKTGRPFARRENPSAANPGWTYVGDETYSKSVDWRTNYISLAGPREDVELTDFYAVHRCNTIPTDLYYASLTHPDYGRPGIRDWDANGNGLYGQNHRGVAIDAAHFVQDLAVGRAPVASGPEARAFVDKVIAYESYDGFAPEFGRRLLLGAGNWGGYLVAEPAESALRKKESTSRRSAAPSRRSTGPMCPATNPPGSSSPGGRPTTGGYSRTTSRRAR
ncbi:MAG: C25 family cysteine peptidase [Planctomycetota bacterium]